MKFDISNSNVVLLFTCKQFGMKMVSDITATTNISNVLDGSINPTISAEISDLFNRYLLSQIFIERCAVRWVKILLQVIKKTDITTKRVLELLFVDTDIHLLIQNTESSVIT